MKQLKIYRTGLSIILGLSLVLVLLSQAALANGTAFYACKPVAKQPQQNVVAKKPQKHTALANNTTFYAFKLLGQQLQKYDLLERYTNKNPMEIGHYYHILEPFNGIAVYGPIDVEIVTQRAHQGIEFTGDPKTMEALSITMKHHTLQINYHPHLLKKFELVQPQKLPHLNLKARVCLPQLKHLLASGSGTIWGKNIKSHSLDIESVGNNRINLNGVVGLRMVTVNGNGQLNLYWVDSPDLIIVGKGHGRVKLAGVARLLDVTLSGNSHLNAKYLRAKKAFINTADESRADVWADDALNALAGDMSNIYYYKDPHFIADYQQANGAVIRMVGIEAKHPALRSSV